MNRMLPQTTATVATPLGWWREFADEWIAQLRAPVKRVFHFENSGHNADAEEPGRFNDLMVNVLAETYRR